MATLVKLTNKLPVITLPSKQANGKTGPWTLDPYLQNNAYWSNGNANSLRNIGFTGWTGGLYQFILSVLQDLIGPKKYVEIINMNGAVDIGFPSEDLVVYEPGNYIAVGSGQPQYNMAVVFPTTYFIFDSYFKSLPFGQLPILANVGNEAWCTGDTPSDCIKLENGTIAIAMKVGSGNLIWKSTWAQSNNVILEIDVQSLPQGGSLRVLTLNGSTALTISAPGRYSTTVNMNAGQEISVVANATVYGSAIINSLKARRVTQSWTCEGLPFAQIGALWCAEPYYFDRIINPQTIHMATSFDRPNMQGWNPPIDEPVLGYGQAPPPSGYFRAGDTIRNNCAIAGSVSGWRCIAAGNPGTWMPLATL